MKIEVDAGRDPDPKIPDFLIFGIIRDPGFFRDLSLGIPSRHR